jgi:hypothetical protein
MNRLRLRHREPAPLIRGLLALCALVLVLAPVPIHACLQADSDDCACCCSHDVAVPMACCGDDVPAPSSAADPDCCFTLDLDTGPLVPLLRDNAPPASMPLLGPAASVDALPGRASGARSPVAMAVPATPRRLAVLCSFLI